MSYKVIFLLFSGCIVFCQHKIFHGSEILNETELHAVPQEMTFEEYQDMNRRIGVGLMISAIPIPGAIHQYAGESKTARRLKILGGIGFGLLVVGAAMEGDKENSKLEDFNIIPIDGTDYYQIPVSSNSTTLNGETSTTIEYSLKKVEVNKDRGNGLVLLLGTGILLGNYIYDYYYGIQVIESKRDKVRYKYGKTIDFTFRPSYNPVTRESKINFAYGF